MVGSTSKETVNNKGLGKQSKRKGKSIDYVSEEELDWLPIIDFAKRCEDQVARRGSHTNVLDSGVEDDEDDGIEPEEEYHSGRSSDGEESVPTDADDEDEYIGGDSDREDLFNEDFVSRSQDVYDEGTHDTDTDTETDELFIGMEWQSVTHCRNFIRAYSISKKFVTAQVRNHRTQQEYKCKDKDCEWRVYCSVLPDQQTFRLRTGVLRHTCKGLRDLKNPMANSKWVADKILEDLRENIEHKPKDIRKIILRRHHVRISYWTAWLARHKCMEKILGSFEESYRMAPECCMQVLLSNPGSIASCSRDDRTEQFKAMCIAYKASLDGFVRGCRPILGLDGCFLKGKYQGMCLSIMSLDANNGMFPIAIYICKNECRETWTTFLMTVAGYLKLHPKPLTIISDRQKGLIESVNDVFGEVNHFHRFCFRHMYKNFKRYHPGSNLETITWLAAKTYSKSEFKKQMEELEKAKKEARQWMDREHPSQWARSHFDTTSKCDHITNNFSESFNSWILEQRAKPICKFVDAYQCMVMRLFYERKMKGRQWDVNDMVPRVKKVINAHKKNYHLYQTEPSTETKWKVDDYKEMSWKVDLQEMTCTCCAWQVSGIPCVHAIAVILPNYGLSNVMKYVDESHTVSAYRRSYQDHIEPLNHTSEWGEPTYNVKPPPLVRPAGRPRTQRRRDIDEQNGVVRDRKMCGKCKEYGHNRSTCKGAPANTVSAAGTGPYEGPHIRNQTRQVNGESSGRGRGSGRGLSRGSGTGMTRGVGSDGIARGSGRGLSRGVGSVGIGRGSGPVELSRGSGPVEMGRGSGPVEMGRGSGSVGMGRGSGSVGLSRGRGVVQGRGVGSVGLSRGRGVGLVGLSRGSGSVGRGNAIESVEPSQTFTQTAQESQITQQSQISQGNQNKKQKLAPVRRSGRIGFRSNPALNGKTFVIDD